MFNFPKFEVASFQTFPDKVCESSVEYFLLQKSHKFLMVDGVEAFRNVPFDNSSDGFKIVPYLVQSCVAASVWSETVGTVQEERFIDGL